jgi:integrase/recombinase XerC
VTGSGPDQGRACAALVRGVALLHPEEQVLEAMLAGWDSQQAARGLSGDTIAGRRGRVRAFTEHAGCPPWQWTPQLFEEWCADLRSVHHVAASTLRGHAAAIRLFCEYVTDPVYAWAEVCWGYFGTHPAQVCTRQNTPRHAQDGESRPERRAFTVCELQAFFDHLAGRVARVHGAGRKGWIPAFRDAVLVKTAYAFGLRRRETSMLDLADLSANPRAPEFGDYGVCRVRYGKASAGSPPRRRSVLTVWGWVPEILDQWITEIRPLLARDGTAALWPSERGPRIGLSAIDRRFAAERDALGLDPALEFHSLRRSHITHLIEAGWDPLFAQQQAGHAHASTTSLYTCVSSDFRTRTLRRALDETMSQALDPRQEGTRR